MRFLKKEYLTHEMHFYTVLRSITFYRYLKCGSIIDMIIPICSVSIYNFNLFHYNEYNIFADLNFNVAELSIFNILLYSWSLKICYT